MTTKLANGGSSVAAPLAVSTDMYRKLFPREYMAKCVENSVRPDSRALQSVRAVHMQTNVIQTAASSSLVKLGNTSVITAIKLSVGLPAVATPDQGDLTIQVHLTPLCSTRFALGRPSEEAQSIGSQLLRIIVGSRVVEMSDLTIEKGKSAWKLVVDVYCMDHDGNVLDAALISVMAALRSLQLPAVSVNEADHIVSLQPGALAIGYASVCCCLPSSLTFLNAGWSSEEKPTQLPLQHSAFSTSFALFQDRLLVDPTSEEEQLADACFSITYNTDGLLCGVQKPGGAILSATMLHECMQIAKTRTQTIAQQLDQLFA